MPLVMVGWSDWSRARRDYVEIALGLIGVVFLAVFNEWLEHRRVARIRKSLDKVMGRDED